MTEAESSKRYVALARVSRPRGNKGEVLARDLCEDPRRFQKGATARLKRPSGAAFEKTIEFSWNHQGRLILKFEGVDSIADAEELRGCEIEIPYEDLGPPPEGEVYYADLIGCEVRDADSDRRIGEVIEIEEPGGAILLVVEASGGEVLIPFRREICVETDPTRKLIRARMIEGLEELNW